METLMEILDKVNGIVQDFIDILGPEIFFVAAIFMLLHCFFGYQLLRVWSTIFGMILGGAIGLLFGTNMAFEVPQVIASVLIAAVALGWVFYQIYLVGIFIIFAAAGAVALHFLNPDASTNFIAIMSVLAGILGVLCVRPFMIVFSAALGGALGSYFLLAAQGNFDFDTLVQRTILFAALGVVCQFILTTPIRTKKNEEEEAAPKDKKAHSRPLIDRIFVKPIEQVQPEEIDHEEGLPSSDDLDRMIAEQMTGMSEDVNDFSADVDFSLFEDAAQEESEDEDIIEDELDENGLPDIPDSVIDEMILEALPDAEEYLPVREQTEDQYEEKLKSEDAVGLTDEVFFDANAQNDFAVGFSAAEPEASAELNEIAERLEKGELRTAEEIEARIADLEELVEAEDNEAKDSIFSNPFKKALTDDIELPVFTAGMSLAEAAAALEAFTPREAAEAAEAEVAFENDAEGTEALADTEVTDDYSPAEDNAGPAEIERNE